MQAPSLTATAAPTGFISIRYPGAGIALSIPRDWTATVATAPMVAVISSGQAVIALWRHPDARRPPATPPALHAALTALLGAARARNRTLRVQRTGLARVDGAGAVIIDGLERIGEHLRRVRSEHVYVPGAELVLEAYAPVGQFATVDHRVFSPVRKSLTLLHGGRPGAGAPTTSTTITPTATVPTAAAGPA